MNSAKKIATFLLAIMIPINILVGYFCFMPQMAMAVAMPSVYSSYASNMSYDCAQTMPVGPIIAPVAHSGSVAPCCLSKKNDSNASAINLNSESLNITLLPSRTNSVASDNNVGSQLILEKYPAPPPQAGLLSSVIKIE